MSEHDADRPLYEAVPEDTGRKHGEHILTAVEASDRAAEKSHPLVQAIVRAYQAREDNQE
jgi:hypothetical protein